jgi:hypothetical protein
MLIGMSPASAVTESSNLKSPSPPGIQYYRTCIHITGTLRYIPYFMYILDSILIDFKNIYFSRYSA